MKDGNGLEISTNSPEAIEVINKFGKDLLSMNKGVSDIIGKAENYSQSAQILEPVINNIMTVGGSDAQVDLFRQTYLLSLIKSGEKKKAKIYLDEISTSVITTPLNDYWRSLI